MNYTPDLLFFLNKPHSILSSLYPNFHHVGFVTILDSIKKAFGHYSQTTWETKLLNRKVLFHKALMCQSWTLGRLNWDPTKQDVQ